MSFLADGLGRVLTNLGRLLAGEGGSGVLVPDGLRVGPAKSTPYDLIGVEDTGIGDIDAADPANPADIFSATEVAWYSTPIALEGATWLTVEVLLQITTTTTTANCEVGVQFSSDGIRWITLSAIDRANAITAVPRNDDGTAAAPDNNGGYAAAATTTAAPLLEDLTPMLPAAVAGGVSDINVNRALAFFCGAYHFARVVLVPSFTGYAPLVAIRVQKASM